MAIEIKELHVRLHVGKEGITPVKEGGTSVSSSGAIDADVLVTKAVKEVLRILKEMEER
jgi:hypothetical protein